MEQISRRVDAAEAFVRTLVFEALSTYKKGEWVALVRARSQEPADDAAM